MQIITDSLQGSGKENEDRRFSSLRNGIFGVLDGATSLNHNSSLPSPTAGARAADIAKQLFQSYAHLSWSEAAERVNAAILDAMRENKIDTSNPLHLWSTAFAVIKLDFYKGLAHWAQIGDCIILARKKTGELIRFPEEEYDHDQENLLIWKKLARETPEATQEKLRELMSPHLETLRQKMNQPGGYGVLNGQAGYEAFLHEGEFSLENIESILMITDGFFLPKENPSIPDDFEELMRWVETRGLTKAAQRIQTLEETDPQCLRYPRVKPHDDKTGIYIKW